MNEKIDLKGIDLKTRRKDRNHTLFDILFLNLRFLTHLNGGVSP
jgi:hypothetical protein